MTWLDALDSTKGVALEAPESTHLLRPFTIAAALLGQVSLSKNVAAEVATLLEIPELEESLIEVALRSSPGREIPIDPLIDRLYEIVRVYGNARVDELRKAN